MENRIITVDFDTQFLIKTLENVWDIYRKRFKSCKKRFSEDSVHDFRVSIRRFIAVINFFSAIVPCQYYKHIRKILKFQLSSFSELRDKQVQILSLKKLIYEFPVLYSYYNYLLSYEEANVIILKDKIEHFENSDLEGLIFFTKLFLYSNSNPIKSYVQDSIKDHTNKTFQEFLFSLDNVVLSNLDTIHSVRLLFKKFRYTMEIIKNLYDLSNDLFQDMNDIQTILGNIQDNRVFYDDLTTFINKQHEIKPSAFTEPVNHILNQRNRLLHKFTDKIDIIKSYKKIIE